MVQIPVWWLSRSAINRSVLSVWDFLRHRGWSHFCLWPSEAKCSSLDEGMPSILIIIFKIVICDPKKDHWIILLISKFTVRCFWIEALAGCMSMPSGYPSVLTMLSTIWGGFFYVPKWSILAIPIGFSFSSLFLQMDMLCFSLLPEKKK